MEWKPKWVALPILDFTREILSRKDDIQALSDWTVSLAEALLLGDSKSKCKFANELIKSSFEKLRKKSEAGQKGMNNRWNYNRKIAPPKSSEEVVAFAGLITTIHGFGGSGTLLKDPAAIRTEWCSKTGKERLSTRSRPKKRKGGRNEKPNQEKSKTGVRHRKA